MTPTSLVSTPAIMNVTLRAFGISKEEALQATVLAMELIAKGKRAFVRVAPEADTWVDFPTGVAHHNGYARFSVVNEPGEWENSKYAITRVPSLGDA